MLRGNHGIALGGDGLPRQPRWFAADYLVPIDKDRLNLFE
jgi:hypothetical protein